jgi:transaldolase
MDPTFTTSLLPVVPHDMTSNQNFVHEQMCHPDNDKRFKTVVREYKGQGWLAIYTRMVGETTHRLDVLDRAEWGKKC